MPGQALCLPWFFFFFHCYLPIIYFNCRLTSSLSFHRALRKALSHLEMRRAARRPNLPLKVKSVLPIRPVVAPLLPVAPAHPASTSEPIILED